MMKHDIRFATPDIAIPELLRVSETISTRWLTAGPVVRDFENDIATLSGCDRAVCYDSCTAAMEMSLRVLGVGSGDEVITTPFTYSATAEVIRNVGAKIVFVDLAPNSFEMDYGKVSEAITEKTKAVIPVDYGGVLCNYFDLKNAIATRNSVFQPATTLQEAIGRVAIVADAAHSFGASRDSKVSGQFADFTCFSFHVLKNITTGGEGGAVVWRNFKDVDNANIERRFRLLGDHGQTSRDKSGGWEYDIALFGYNHIMTNLDAAMGLAQLGRLNEITERRRRVTVAYDELLSDLQEDFGAGPLLRHLSPGHTSAMHLYPVYIPPKDVPDDRRRNAVYRALANAGVPCNVHYKPLPMMTAYRDIGFGIVDFPNAYAMYRSLLTIPYHTELSLDDQRYVAEQLGKAVSRL